jgi:hypothetical protein
MARIRAMKVVTVFHCQDFIAYGTVCPELACIGSLNLVPQRLDFDAGSVESSVGDD